MIWMMKNVLARIFVSIIKIVRTKVVREMIKTAVIFALFAYSVLITYKYTEAIKSRDYYRNKLKQFYEWYEFKDTSKFKIAEGEINRETIKYVYKTQKETVKVYEIVPTQISDTLRAVFAWTWYDFLYVRDTIKLYQDKDYIFKTKIFRVWNIQNPLLFEFWVYERKPEAWYYTVYTNNPDVSQFVAIEGKGIIPKKRWYLGAGVDYYWDNRLGFYLQNSLVYKRFKFDLRVSDKYISTGINYRIY